MNGFLQWEVFQFHHLRRVVEEDDSVAHEDTHQRDETEDGSHRDGYASDKDTHRRAEDAERQAYHNQQSLADILEVPQQHKEDDGNGDDQRTCNLRSGIFIVIILATYLHLYAFGQHESL